MPEERILTEAAIFADKSSIDEEITRLNSHLDQLEKILTSGGEYSRQKAGFSGSGDEQRSKHYRLQSQRHNNY